jgi:hypothetical protein
MKRAILALLALTSFFWLHADQDILVNSNFSEGHAHWRGDAQDPDSGSTDLGAINNTDSGGNTGGVIIKLKADGWTKIYQSFQVHSDVIFYQITYKLSNDYKQRSNNMQDTSQADFGEVPGFDGAWSLFEKNWYILIPGGSYTERRLDPDQRKKNKAVTMTGRLTGLTKDDDTQFVLAFPPGKGTVTLFKVALSLKDPNAEPVSGPQ